MCRARDNNAVVLYIPSIELKTFRLDAIRGDGRGMEPRRTIPGNSLLAATRLSALDPPLISLAAAAFRCPHLRERSGAVYDKALYVRGRPNRKERFFLFVFLWKLRPQSQFLSPVVFVRFWIWFGVKIEKFNLLSFIKFEDKTDRIGKIAKMYCPNFTLNWKHIIRTAPKEDIRFLETYSWIFWWNLLTDCSFIAALDWDIWHNFYLEVSYNLRNNIEK